MVLSNCTGVVATIDFGLDLGWTWLNRFFRFGQGLPVTAQARERFSQLVQPRLDEGYRLARWLTGNAADADDVLQDACLRAYRAVDDYAGGDSRSWFLTIVRNTCYSWLAQHRSRTLVSSEDLGAHDRTMLETGGAGRMPDDTPESRLIGKDEVSRIAQTIEALPVDLKEILVLREYHGLSYREIAAVGGLPVGTVMSRLARAKRILLARLETST